jgi:hypothetical protein
MAPYQDDQEPHRRRTDGARMDSELGLYTGRRGVKLLAGARAAQRPPKSLLTLGTRLYVDLCSLSVTEKDIGECGTVPVSRPPVTILC